MIGWSDAEGLINETLNWEQFREIIYKTYKEKDYKTAGRSAGNIWRFIREMHIGDLVVVPDGSNFHIAEVTDEPYHDASKRSEDTAHRRKVKWLNKNPIPRLLAPAALQSRMKAYNTCTRATDLLAEIQSILDTHTKGTSTTFDQDLKKSLIETTLKNIRTGKINPKGFERLIRTLFNSLGAIHITPQKGGKADKGADLVATFKLANTFPFSLAIQAKHYKEKPPVPKSDIEQLVKGMEAESTDLGLFVTSGTFSNEALEYINDLKDKQGLIIETIDGEQLASLIIEKGLGNNPWI